jgi:preprotein translocase subunit SecA
VFDHGRYSIINPSHSHVSSWQEPVLRASRYFCLVDEADSILIDEARTPLIISKQGDPPREKYGVAAQVAQLLRCGKDYLVDEKAQVSGRILS